MGEIMRTLLPPTTTSSQLRLPLLLISHARPSVSLDHHHHRLRGEELLLGPWNGLARVQGVGKVMEGRRRGQNWMLRFKQQSSRKPKRRSWVVNLPPPLLSQVWD